MTQPCGLLTGRERSIRYQETCLSTETFHKGMGCLHNKWVFFPPSPQRSTGRVGRRNSFTEETAFFKMHHSRSKKGLARWEEEGSPDLGGWGAG